MNLSAFIDAGTLAATLVFQIKKAIRTNTAIVGPYPTFPPGPVAGFLALPRMWGAALVGCRSRRAQRSASLLA